jgi:hypothetical protein
MTHRSLFIPLIAAALFCLTPGVAKAQANVPDAPLPLCMPGEDSYVLGECRSSGPVDYLDQMAAHNIQFPLQALPAQKADFSVREDFPYHYARVTVDQVRIFGSPEEASLGETPRQVLRKGLNYLSFIDSTELNGKRYYMIEPGAWVRSDEVNAQVLPSDHVGLEFTGTPKNHFGWTIFPIESQRNPGVNDPQPSGNFYDRYAVVQVYDWLDLDGDVWLMIGPDEWLAGQNVAVVYPTAQAPEGVANGRWIEINLYEQTVAVYEDNHMVFATVTASGQWGWWTQPGLFQIYEKLETTVMSGAFEADFSDYYFLEDVPWTMYFDQLRALHGAYWHNSFGQPRSHGCANLAPGDSWWLFNWAQLGDWVYVWDPSGQTPTDPALYSEGGF